MAEIINLRQMRKRKARAERADQAAENRMHHGISKVDRDRQAALGEKECRHLDGHRLDRPPDQE